jgi:hypothetical protein
VAFAGSPYWQDVETYVRKVSHDLMKNAAGATRDEHDRERGKWEGADLLWARLNALLKEWREETSRG